MTKNLIFFIKNLIKELKIEIVINGNKIIIQRLNYNKINKYLYY
jgi:hypothetical protein